MSVQARAILPLLLLVLTPCRAASQPAAQPRFTTEASAVVLDVVVRDTRGQPVTGLTREDFEVFEGRSRQTITVFEGPATHVVEGGRLAPGPAAATSVGGVGATPPRVVALVFEQLGPAARDLASSAARRLVEALGREDFAAVFTVDRAVHTVVNYTPTSSPVLDAIAAATNKPGLPLRRAGVVPGAEFASSGGGQPTPETRDEAKRNRGFATLDALSQIIRGLSLLPGRKMIVLFSEGLALDASEEEFRFLEPMGPGPSTTAGSPMGGSNGSACDRGGERGASRLLHLRRGWTADRKPVLECRFRTAPYVGLLALAEGTGGAFVENTNDLAPGAIRAAEDQAHYYVLGYTASKAPDGEYRELRVRTRSESCTVLARRGYRASSRRARQIGVRDVAPFLVLDGDGTPADLPVTADATMARWEAPRTSRSQPHCRRLRRRRAVWSRSSRG